MLRGGGGGVIAGHCAAAGQADYTLLCNRCQGAEISAS
jgi:hypothetical protein